MDVEYIPLETNDEFVTQGKVMAIGAEVILITNWANDGNLFVFDRKTGKALKKINRKGQGGEEYVGITEVVLDEANKEIFVIAYTGSKISVYDLYGNFKRSFKAEGTESHINTFNYDRDNLISYVPDNSLENPSNAIPPYYLIFSKQDGSITRKISIPFDEVKSPVARDGENWENWAAPVPTAMYQIVPDHTNWVLMETSSDTIYHYLPDANTTIPLIVRTPSIHSMDPPEVFLIPTVFTDRYYFMSLLKAEFNFETGRGFPTSGLMYETVELLYENGLVHDVADLYDLKAGQLAELPRLGEKSADNIIRSIRGSVEVPFRRVLFGLGIRFVGETTAKYLAEHFRSLDAVMRATREELTQADEVGGRIADAIIEYFADEQNHAIIRRLRAAGLKFEEEARELASESLAGRSFVVSGKFSRSRDEMKELIEMHGGRNLAAVSANVDYIVAGDNMGPAKLRKAEKLGVKIISEEEFIAMVGGQEAPAANGTEADSATTANTGGRNNGAPAATEGGDGEPVQQGELF